MTTTAIDTDPPEPPPAAAMRGTTRPCSNCGAPMHGPYCYACGQPEKGMIRHLASVMSDVLDTIFNIDSRVFRSIFPLYFRPGYLTLEYFAGRRVRYVTPFRLFFFLCIVAFFAIQLALNIDGADINIGGNMQDIDHAKTEAEVDQRMKAALAGIEAAKAAPNMPESAIKSLQKSEDAIRKSGEKRLAYLKLRDQALKDGKPAPPDPAAADDDLMFDGQPWDPDTHPLHVSWLPAFANSEINTMAGRAKQNILAAKKNPRHLIEAVMSRLPWTLGLMMPLFAVLLKIMYMFKRRLYMEHLMVALHSHAFIFMSLLLLAIVSLLSGWTATSAPGLSPLWGLLRAAIWIWLPIYLFLMQKRVYRQGWFMTTVKYSVIGICYSILVSFVLILALVATLALE